MMTMWYMVCQTSLWKSFRTVIMSMTKKQKKELYQRFGVKEYGIVNSATKQASGYELITGSYVNLEGSYGTLSSRLFNHSFSF